ncbi:MAG: hypothetical protein IJP27_04400 [Clostridia bacterium]|nr:hypothetical protein [Clostridia bacterium]
MGIGKQHDNNSLNNSTLDFCGFGSPSCSFFDDLDDAIVDGTSLHIIHLKKLAGKGHSPKGQKKRHFFPLFMPVLLYHKTEKSAIGILSNFCPKRYQLSSGKAQGMPCTLRQKETPPFWVVSL